MTTERQPFEDVSQIKNRWFFKSHVSFFGYIRQDDTLCLFVGIPLSLGHRFLAKSPRPRLGLLVPAVSLTYFAISKSPARRFGKGKLSSFDLWRSMKVDSSQFFDDFCSSWIFRRTKHFVASKFLGAPIWCNPQMWCPGHFVGTWLVWHLCGVPMAMILHLSWWYGQFFQQGWLGMTSRLKFQWKSKWYMHPMTEFQWGPQCPPFQAIFGTGRWLRIPPERLGFSCWIRSNHIPPTQRFCRVTEGCCCECVKYADVVPKNSWSRSKRTFRRSTTSCCESLFTFWLTSMWHLSLHHEWLGSGGSCLILFYQGGAKMCGILELQFGDEHVIFRGRTFQFEQSFLMF